VWAILLSTALFLGVLQALLMSDIWWIAGLMIVLPVGLYLFLHWFIRAVLSGRAAAVIALLAVALAHLILPLRQVIGSRPPGVDGMLSALAAAILFLTLLPQQSELPSDQVLVRPEAW
jgi:hypothetical protein